MRATRSPGVAVSIYVFIGPTISRDDAMRVLGAEYLPPVRAGDVARLTANGKPSAVGIVDGYFHHVPSVWHKEILHALRLGIPVYGASSMGALRAAELSAFGMIGVGEIFEAYESGRWTDDDEVAVSH